MWDKETQDISIQDEDKQFVIDFFKYALVGMTLEWIRKDMNRPRTVDPAAQQAAHGGIRRTLLKFQAGGQKTNTCRSGQLGRRAATLKLSEQWSSIEERALLIAAVTHARTAPPGFA